MRETLRKLAKLKLRTVDLTPKVSRLAARLIPDCNIKAPDAVVVATANHYPTHLGHLNIFLISHQDQQLRVQPLGFEFPIGALNV